MTDERKWETFTAGRGSQMNARLGKEGKLYFHEQWWERIGSPTTVVLMYDQATGTIGIRPAKDHEYYAYKVGHQTNSTARYVNVRSFARHFGIDHSEKRVLEPSVEDGVLILSPVNTT